jgi:hypothetical protein
MKGVYSKEITVQKYRSAIEREKGEKKRMTYEEEDGMRGGKNCEGRRKKVDRRNRR